MFSTNDLVSFMNYNSAGNNNLKDNFDLSPLKKKKRKNSKAKGSSFERKVAKILNERFNTNEFARTPGSGAFATTHTLPKHLQIWGDLITPENFKYIFECKSGYNNEGIHSLINPKSRLWGWVTQMERDAESAEKPSILLISQDRKPIITFIKYKEEIEKSINTYSIVIINNNKYILLYLTDLLGMDDSLFINKN